MTGVQASVLPDGSIPATMATDTGSNNNRTKDNFRMVRQSQFLTLSFFMTAKGCRLKYAGQGLYQGACHAGLYRKPAPLNSELLDCYRNFLLEIDLGHLIGGCDEEIHHIHGDGG